MLRSRQAESDALAEVNTRERNYRRGLAVADMVAAGGAMIAAFLLIGQDQLRPSYLLVMPLIVLVSKIQGLYDHDDLVMTRSTVDELPKLANLATLFALLLFLSRHLIISGTPGGRDVVAVWVLLIVFLAVSRYIARAIAAAVSPVERCAVLGDLGVYRRLQSKVGNRRGLALVCAVPLDEVLSGEVTVEDLARDQQVHRLIIAPTETVSGDDTIDVVRAAKATGLRVSLLPACSAPSGAPSQLDNLGGITLLGVPRFGLSRSSAACKRAFDLVGVTLLLIATAPLLAVCALLIKLDSPGPVLFRQIRVGSRRQALRIQAAHDVHGADAMKSSCSRPQRGARDCSRSTTIRASPASGRWLRRTHLDELPQLFNVVRGEMSLVGPRPLIARRGQDIVGLRSSPPLPHAGHDRPVADPRRAASRWRDGQARLPVRRQLVALGRREDPAAHGPIVLAREGQ